MISVYSHLVPFIVQIGTGGTGTYTTQHLAQMLGTLGKKHVYVLADPDQIERKNLKNQLFLEEEIGLPKAEVLAERYSQSFNLNIWSHTEKYIETVEDLKNLFVVDYASALTSTNYYLPILIGCVDNNFSRQIMNEFFEAVPSLIYIDAGNESVQVPSDWLTRPMEQWTDEEKEAYANSGYSGQVVIGVKKDNEVLQEPLAQKFPDVLSDTDSIAPSEVSCSDLSASEPQRLITNKFASLAVLNAVQEIVYESSITNHITHFHSKQGYMRSVQRQEKDDLTEILELLG
ncbi:thiamine biosynthesis protein ThiF [Butyricicoccus sp. 1XD8-22]|nr:thiamine biosynthesis protein ThiF [Butyricicoccus sp. 1XD8-22]